MFSARIEETPHTLLYTLLPFFLEWIKSTDAASFFVVLSKLLAYWSEPIFTVQLTVKNYEEYADIRFKKHCKNSWLSWGKCFRWNRKNEQEHVLLYHNGPMTLSLFFIFSYSHTINICMKKKLS